MDTQDITLHFSDNAEEEIEALINDTGLLSLAERIDRNKDIPDDVRHAVGELVLAVADMFSTIVPDTDANPEQTLKKISRDVKLSQLLRERAYVRLYRLVKERTWITAPEMAEPVQVPVFMTLRNPDTGEPFSQQEDFIGWLCDAARISRSSAFGRLKTISRLTWLGYDLQDVFRLMLTKPQVISQTLSSLAKDDIGWETQEEINVDVVTRIAEKVLPEAIPEIQGGDVEAIKPVISKLVEEIADHDRSKETQRYIKHDILGKPEIDYYWDEETDSLVVKLTRREINPATGEESILPPEVIPWVADAARVPKEVRADLIRRLPIKNRPYIE